MTWPDGRSLVLACLVSSLVACQTATPLSDRASCTATAGAAAEAWVDDALSAAELIAGGKRLYEAEGESKSANDYCRSGQDLIDRGELRLGIRDKMKALYLSEVVGSRLLAAQCARGLALGYAFAGRFEHAELWADQAIAYVGLARDASAEARIVLLTLWPIADESTALLMETFYREMRSAPARAVAVEGARGADVLGALHARRRWAIGPHPVLRFSAPA
jgi:hypothetical protein